MGRQERLPLLDAPQAHPVTEASPPLSDLQVDRASGERAMPASNGERQSLARVITRTVRVTPSQDGKAIERALQSRVRLSNRHVCHLDFRKTTPEDSPTQIGVLLRLRGIVRFAHRRTFRPGVDACQPIEVPAPAQVL
jgi:hypothetical protein